MKKLLFILLIAIIVCEITEDHKNLREQAGLLAELKAKITSAVASILKNLLKTSGKAAAVNKCCSMYSGYCSVCSKAVSTL